MFFDFEAWSSVYAEELPPSLAWKVSVHLPRRPSNLESSLAWPPLAGLGCWERWPAGRKPGDSSLHSWGLSLRTQAPGISHHVPQKESLLITNPKGHLSGKEPSVSSPGRRERGPWPFWRPPGFPDGDVLFLACKPLWVSSVGGVWMGQVDRG